MTEDVLTTRSWKGVLYMKSTLVSIQVFKILPLFQKKCGYKGKLFLIEMSIIYWYEEKILLSKNYENKSVDLVGFEEFCQSNHF